MNVSLTDELEKYVDHKLASGLYGSASEVIREALRLLEERDRALDARLEHLRTEMQRGLDSLDAGRHSPFDTAALDRIKSAGKKRLASTRRKKRA